MRLRLVPLIVTFALGLLAAPLHAEAQKPRKVYRIGWLTEGMGGVANFTEELRDVGWVEGKNFVMEHRLAERERLPDLATELVRSRMDVIVAVGTPAIRAAMNATKTIPIVFVAVVDPVESGFVTSLARPGRNATGVTNIFPELGGKQLKLLKEAVPGISRLAVLWDPDDPANPLLFRQIQSAAQALAVTLQPVEVRSRSDFDSAFSVIIRKRADGLFVLASGVTISDWIPHLALTNRLPMMSNSNWLTWQEGLMSYGPNVDGMGRRAAHYVDKILRGTNPADLPVEQLMDFELAINLYTAKALGLTIPESLLMRADEVIR